MHFLNTIMFKIQIALSQKVLKLQTSSLECCFFYVIVIFTSNHWFVTSDLHLPDMVTILLKKLKERESESTVYTDP